MENCPDCVLIFGALENQHKNLFELRDDKAYAGTDADVWQAIRFFNELKVFDLKELEPEDQKCSICGEPYDDLDEDDIPCARPAALLAHSRKRVPG